MAQQVNSNVYEINEENFVVMIDGEVHTVNIKAMGSGRYEFFVDERRERQICHGHPAITPQAPGYPTAAEICILKGPKFVNLAWMTYWDDGRYEFVGRGY